MRTRVTGLCLASLALCLLGQPLSAAEPAKQASEATGSGHCATIAPLPKEPTLDGAIADGEWDNATGTINFMQLFAKEEPSFNAMHMDPREGRTLVGYYGDTLYICVVSALPPRAVYGEGKHSKEMPRDAELIGDFNAVEIWLDPNRDRRESRQGDQSFYQVFVNTVGSLYDAKLVPGESPDKGWNTDIRSANAIDPDKKIWTAEIAISLKDFGWTAENAAGKSMGILISRNYKAPWNQATWFTHDDAFVSWHKYPRVYFTKDGPVARIESLGDRFWEAKPEWKVKIFNPGPAQTVKASIHVKSSDMPDLKNEKEIALPANGTGEYTFAATGEQLHQQADHYFKLRMTSADGTKAYFDYVGLWSYDYRTTKGSGAAMRYVRRSELRPFERKWEIRAEAAPAQSVGMAVYPSYNLIRVNIDAGMLVGDPDGQDKDKVSGSAHVVLSRDGKELAAADLSWTPAKMQYTARHEFKLPEMPAGEYVVTAKFDKHADPIVMKYTREAFVWEGTKLGVTETIYPPFTAVEASNDSTSVVCRKYGIGDLGLWKSVQSLDKEILAAPIVLKADGARVLTGAAKLTDKKPMAATYVATATDDAVTVKSTCVTEIDGAMKVTLTLEPGAKKAELKSLALEIPMKDELVTLWHACTTALRVNPCGQIPQGTGNVWDSRKFPNGDWIGNFTPYIWVGGAERGLVVFGNNDRGWVLDWNEKKQFAPCQEMIRENGALTLRLNLVQKPITIEEPRTIVIGLMASPGKPIPYKDWRGILPWNGNSLGKEFNYLPTHNFDMGRSVETTFCAAYPINRDYSAYDATMMVPGSAAAQMVKEKGWNVFFEDWKQRNGLDKPADQLTDEQKYALSRTPRPGGANSSKYFGMYWDEYHSDFHKHPEVRVFNGEWGGNNMAQSRRDFRCYYAAETVKRGIGLYFDNSYPHASRDMVTSEAYEIPGLGIQPSAGIWEQRDYHRRIWNIHREFGAQWKNKPMNMIHMTNTNLITMLTWNDMNVDLEWFYGPEPQQSKYGLPLLQAETAARQSGCIPYALAIIQGCKTPEEQRIAERSKFGTMMVHDIRINFDAPQISKLARILFGFGYGISGIIDSPIAGDTVYNYWADNCPFTCDKDLVKGLLVKRGEELMLLVCSWDKDPTTATFTLDADALGFAVTAARDAEGTPEEQVAEYTARIPAAEKLLVEAQEKLAATQKLFDEKKADENQLKTAQIIVSQREAGLVAAKAMPALVVEAAKLPVKLNAKRGTLTVGMSGYGVRIIRMK